MSGLDRLGMTQGLAALGATLTEAGRRSLRYRLDEEQAAMHLLALAGPRIESLLPEVDRRAEMFDQRARSVPYTLHETPRAAACRSVADDVAKGWL